MDEKTKLLIAVGAAVTANCQPCLKTILKKAKEVEISDKEIQEAIGVARIVRKNSAIQIDRFMAGLTGAAEETTGAGNGCGCT